VDSERLLVIIASRIVVAPAPDLVAVTSRSQERTERKVRNLVVFSELTKALQNQQFGGFVVNLRNAC